jgi:hypothetical protein
VPCTPARAAGTGQIAGTVTDARTGAPLANAAISVTSPSDRYHTTTDANGRFSLAGVTVDTYTISTEKQGYGTFALVGVTVTQDETYRVAIKLTTAIRTIGKTRARSITSAYQPDQLVDRTIVNAQGIDQLLGNSFSTNGRQLLSELPGVTVDKNNTVLVRGGTSFEGALEFEGIDYTEPNRSLTNRFENVGSNYLLNGVGSIEIIPGGGDATHGNTGTGLISLTAKRGTSPAFATLDYEQGTLGGGNPSNQAGSSTAFPRSKIACQTTLRTSAKTGTISTDRTEPIRRGSSQIRQPSTRIFKHSSQLPSAGSTLRRSSTGRFKVRVIFSTISYTSSVATELNNCNSSSRRKRCIKISTMAELNCSRQCRKRSTIS